MYIIMPIKNQNHSQNSCLYTAHPLTEFYSQLPTGYRIPNLDQKSSYLIVHPLAVNPEFDWELTEQLIVVGSPLSCE